MEYKDMNTAGEVSSGQNLDDSPVLPGLFDAGSTAPVRGAGQISEELVSSPESQNDDDNESEPELDSPKSPKRRSRVQDRISRLVAQRNEKAGEADSLRQHLASVQQELAALRNQVTRLPAPTVASSGNVKGDTFSFLDGNEEPRSTPAAAPAGADIASIVDAAVNRALKPIIDQTRVSAKEQSLRVKHEAAFAEAVEDYPELGEATSEMRQVFNQLYDARADLRQQEDAPILIAHMARGLLADARRSEQKSAARKRAAAIHTPTPTGTDDIPDGGPTRLQKAALQKARENLRNGTATLDDYKVIRLSGLKQTR